MKVSVIIPVYNGRKYLRAAVESCLAEPVKDLQILVLDDGSSDHPEAVLEDLPVEFHRSEKNRGIGATINWGFQWVTGDVVTFMDCDDLMSPGGLQWRVEYLEKNSQAQAVGGRPAGIIGEQGEPRPEYVHVLHPEFRPPQKLDWSFIESGGVYPLSILLFLYRRSFMQKIGPFREDLRSAQDCDYMLRALMIAEIPVVFEPVFLRRLHGDNHSHALESGQRELQPRTRQEVIDVYKTFGINLTGELHLWEHGYRPPGPEFFSKRQSS